MGAAWNALLSAWGLAPWSNPAVATSVTAKTVVFDIADNWGDGSYVGVTAIEFKLGGVLVAVTTEFTAYSTTNYSGSYQAQYVFDTSKDKTGSGAGTSWFSAAVPSNQRLIVVFDSEQTFDEIVVNNFHIAAGSYSMGAQNVKITWTASSYTDTTYNASVTGGTVLNNTAWPQHVAGNVADDQTVWTFS